MTISQPSSHDSSSGAGAWSGAAWGASWARALAHALSYRCERRRAAADLQRLAAAGDHLLRDVGLDPKLARENPAAAVDQVMRREGR